jgi:hypothetical protein
MSRTGTVAAALGGECALWAGGLRKIKLRAGHPLTGNAVYCLGRVRERQLSKGNEITVDLKGVQVEVVDVVACLVIARVELLTRGTSPNGRLLWRLHHLSAGE